MKLLVRLLCGAAVLSAAAAFVSTPAKAAVAPVVVKQCFITAPKALSKNASGTQIDYIIYGHKAAKSITFAVGYRNVQSTYLRKVTDVGMFSPGVEIRHHFSLYSDVTYAGQTTRSCIPMEVKWADASLWLAPAH